MLFTPHSGTHPAEFLQIRSSRLRLSSRNLSDDGLHKGTALQPSRAIPSGMTL